MSSTSSTKYTTLAEVVNNKILYALNNYYKRPNTRHEILEITCEAIKKDQRLFLFLLLLFKEELISPLTHRKGMKNLINL